MSRLTKKNNQGTGSWTQFGDEYIPAHNIKYKQCVNKLGKLEDLMEKYNINDLVDLEIALDYYNHRFDDVQTKRIDKNEIEEFGCPLEVVFEAINNEIIDAKGNPRSVSLSYGPIRRGSKKEYYFTAYDYDGSIMLSLRDYKYTWWLKKDRSK